MWTNIKSSFILQKIFLNLNARTKFKLISYNRNIKHQLNINIKDFRRFSGKYIIKDKNGLVKEYNSDKDQLIYEGEYLTGKRHGKGKEFDSVGNKIYEGEYFNGQRWNGKGTEFDEMRQIKFEGEYKKGKKIGKRTEFYKYKIFEGEYLNGKRNGKGKELNGRFVEFEGEYLDGKRHGKGKEYDRNGKLVFEGEYLYNFRKEGKEYVNIYEKADKEFLFLYGTNKKYVSTYLEFEGEYLCNKKWNGKGYDEKGNIIYELINGKGKVKEYNNFDCNLIYEGEYLDGKRNGKGKEYDNILGKIFEGEFLNGKKWKGKETEYNLDHKVYRENEYIEGKIVETKKYELLIL